MSSICNLKPENVFKYFSEICAIPHGSENMEQISRYCIDFAERFNLRYYTDNSHNVVIYKDGTGNKKNDEPVILQGHLDMVCQHTADKDIDFLKDGLDIYCENGYIKAHGTSLGADNGIAVAMILAVLEENTLSHPPIEAVFTTDEEIGMIGALNLDMSVLKAKRMINLDAEEDDTVTVSCAGGSDFIISIPINNLTSFQGTRCSICISGLKGGHSGVEINSNRVNSNILAGRLLNHLSMYNQFEIISINGGTKGNAIADNTIIELSVKDTQKFSETFYDFIKDIKNEIISREPEFVCDLKIIGNEVCEVLDNKTKNDLIFALSSVPNGVIEMSAEIENLVETSLNLGVLLTKNDEIKLHFTLRSNKKSGLIYLEEKLSTLFSKIDGHHTVSGHYPPWEYKDNSELQKTFLKVYNEFYGKKPKVEAIHAGLECGVFSTGIKDLDCIAIGPQLFDVHTTNERLSVASTKNTYELLIKLLEDI